MKNEVVYIMVRCPLHVGLGFEHTFEYREPRKGEWFIDLHKGKWQRVQAPKDLDCGAVIIKRKKPWLRTV